MAWYLTGDETADALLADDPLALLIGMVLDQQVPMERAFSAPRDLRERLGGRLDVTEIAGLDHDRLVAAFSERPALHRFPAAMAERVQAVANIVVDEYGGDAGAIWNTAADGKELMKRLRALPGFGEQKAKIFLALLGKRLGVRPAGWEEAAGPFGKAGSFVSVADIDSPEAMERVRDHKREMKAAAKSAANLPAKAGAGRAKK
ncbi:MAG TPA: HhH-GPD-type base excision DNA repair protein [Acidimicrobiales bacterium]|nr:HhH-GPD-type base excision DNA repair protein [Acidimicrobiales bacterium]